MEVTMHVLEAALVANLMQSPRRTILEDCRIEPQIDWPLDRRQFEELTEMIREAQFPPLVVHKPNILARLRRWLTIGEPGAARNVA
jgi:hypothetical protein